MATTDELLFVLERQNQGHSRDGEDGLLSYLNRAQQMLCQIPAPQFLLWGPNGKLPSVDTVEGEYVYEMPDNVRVVNTILVEVGTSGTLFNVVGADYDKHPGLVRSNDRVCIAGTEYWRVPYVTTQPATAHSVARVQFTINPKTTTGKFRRESYRTIPALLSDSAALTIPPPWDEEYLLPATQLLISAHAHGNWIESTQGVSDLKKAMLNAMTFDGGEQGLDTNPVRRF